MSFNPLIVRSSSGIGLLTSSKVDQITLFDLILVMTFTYLSISSLLFLIQSFVCSSESYLSFVICCLERDHVCCYWGLGFNQFWSKCCLKIWGSSFLFLFSKSLVFFPFFFGFQFVNYVIWFNSLDKTEEELWFYIRLLFYVIRKHQVSEVCLLLSDVCFGLFRFLKQNAYGC